MLIKPLGTLQSCDLIAAASDLDKATCVLASNGGTADPVKRFVFVVEGSTTVASICLPAYAMVRIRKQPDQKLFAAQGPGGTGGATGGSFTKIAHTD